MTNNLGLLGLHEDLRYWHEEGTCPRCLHWLPSVMKAAWLADIEAQVIAMIRRLEQEIGG